MNERQPEADMVVLADAARELGVSVATLYRALARDGIKTFKELGDRKAYLRRDDLARLRGFRVQPGRATE